MGSNVVINEHNYCVVSKYNINEHRSGFCNIMAVTLVLQIHNVMIRKVDHLCRQFKIPLKESNCNS